MTTPTPPTDAVITIIADLAGAAAFIALIRNTEPDARARFLRQVNPAGQEAMAGEEAAEQSTDFFDAKPGDRPTSEGRPMAPGRGVNRGPE